MKGSPDSICLGNGCLGRCALSGSETADLNLLANLAGRFFNVEIAYSAMLGRPDQVMCRIGLGSDYSKYLKTLPLGAYLSAPQVIRVEEGLPEGAALGELKFAASAPINTLCGRSLGVLVIADAAARPDFSGQDLKTLVEFASIIGDKLELRMIARQALESRSRCEEAEERFRETANRAETLIVCIDDDGTCEFVNNAWLNFTGRHKRREPAEGWQLVIHEEQRERFVSVYLQALQMRQPFTVELPLQRRDGVFRWMQASGAPRLLRDSGFAGFTIRLTDLGANCEDSAP